MRNFILFLILLCSYEVANATETSAPHITPNRNVVIMGAIGGHTFVETAKSLMRLSRQSKEPIDLILSSPGGSIVSGFMIINAMEEVRAKGIILRCFVPTLAASMAFQLFLHCDERYAADHSFLLWHGVRVQMGMGEEMTAPRAALLAQDLELNNEVILNELINSLSGMEHELVEFHFFNETFHVASQLAQAAPGFMKTFSSLPGTMDLLSVLSDKRDAENKARVKQGEKAPSFAPGTITYQWEGLR